MAVKLFESFPSIVVMVVQIIVRILTAQGLCAKLV